MIMEHRIDDQNEKPRRVWPSWATTLAIIGASFFVGGLLILAIGLNPLKAYGALLVAAFGSVNGISETLLKACPLLLAGLGIAVAYRAQFWNIGAEGQIYAGGIVAAITGLYLPEMPAWIHLPLALLAGMLGGALLGAVPAILKTRLKVNEVITTLMLNFVMIELTNYLLNKPMRDMVSGINISPQLVHNAWLPIIIPRTRFHLGIIISVVFAGLLYLLMSKTVLGFRIRAVGESARAARIAGIPVERIVVISVIISGALAGMAGATEVAGVHHRLVPHFSPGYGYLAIAVALLGNLEPLGIVFASVLFAALLNGADAMQRAADVPIPVIYVIEGLVIIFVTARALSVRSKQ
jgi:general nucleoside transport system permease protein